jgi:hypothetical protein
VTRCSREGSDASPLGAAAIAEFSPRSMDVPALASAAAAAFLLTRFCLQQCSQRRVHGKALVSTQRLQVPAPLAHTYTVLRMHVAFV